MLTKKQTYIAVAIGVLLIIIGTFFSSDLILLLAHLTVIFSSWSLAKAKGYKAIWGIILGLFLNVVGFIVLVILRDKKKTN